MRKARHFNPLGTVMKRDNTTLVWHKKETRRTSRAGRFGWFPEKV